MAQTNSPTEKPKTAAPKKPVDIVFNEFAQTVTSLQALGVTARLVLENQIDVEGNALTKEKHGKLVGSIASKLNSFNKEAKKLIEDITK